MLGCAEGGGHPPAALRCRSRAAPAAGGLLCGEDSGSQAFVRRSSVVLRTDLVPAGVQVRRVVVDTLGHSSHGTGFRNVHTATLAGGVRGTARRTSKRSFRRLLASAPEPASFLAARARGTLRTRGASGGNFATTTRCSWGGVGAPPAVPLDLETEGLGLGVRDRSDVGILGGRNAGSAGASGDTEEVRGTKQ